MQIRRICLIRIAASKQAHDDVTSGIYVGFFQVDNDGDKCGGTRNKKRSIDRLLL